jgi:hypothetical protein
MDLQFEIHEKINNESGCFTSFEIENVLDVNEIAFTGKCFIYTQSICGFNGYISDVFENPTYLDLLKMADKQIEATGDTDHCFLEGVNINTTLPNGIKQLELRLGS